MTAEQGKPLAEARARSPTRPRSSSGSPRKARIYGDVIPGHQADKRMVVLRQPVGVVGGDHAVELPGGDDHARPARRSPPAAPSSEAGDADAVLSALALAELATRAGIPPGVFSVITGDARRSAAEITSNPMVRRSASPAPPRSARR